MQDQNFYWLANRSGSVFESMFHVWEILAWRERNLLADPKPLRRTPFSLFLTVSFFFPWMFRHAQKSGAFLLAMWGRKYIRNIFFLWLHHYRPLLLYAAGGAIVRSNMKNAIQRTTRSRFASSARTCVFTLSSGATILKIPFLFLNLFCRIRNAAVRLRSTLSSCHIYFAILLLIGSTRLLWMSGADARSVCVWKGRHTATPQAREVICVSQHRVGATSGQEIPFFPPIPTEKRDLSPFLIFLWEVNLSDDEKHIFYKNSIFAAPLVANHGTHLLISPEQSI